MQEYPQLLTYAVICQDSMRLELEESNKSLLLSETTTSSHDTGHQMTNFLHIRNNFFKVFPKEKKLCELAMLDFTYLVRVNLSPIPMMMMKTKTSWSIRRLGTKARKRQ